MNSVWKCPSVYSCAIDSFMELVYYVLFPEICKSSKLSLMPRMLFDVCNIYKGLKNSHVKCPWWHSVVHHVLTGICLLTTDIKVKFNEDSLKPPPSSESDNCGSFLMCCQEIESIIVDTFLVCKKCLKKIKLIPGTGIICCGHCNREYLIEAVTKWQLRNGSYPRPKEQNECCFCYGTVFSKTLTAFFDDNVLGYDLPELKTKVLKLKNIDFTINSKRIISKMFNHV